MNNFRKHSVFYIITFAHWCPQEGGKSRRSPLPWKLQNYGFFHYLKYVLFFSFWGGGLVFPFRGHFLHVGWGRFSLCGAISWLVPTCKNFYDAHALDARVVANMAPWRSLREIARLNLLIHFGAHFLIIIEKTNEMIQF